MRPTFPRDQPTAAVWFQPTWVKLEQPSPFAEPDVHRSAATRNEAERERRLTPAGLAMLEAVAEFNARWCAPPRGPAPARPPRPGSSWPGWYEPRDMIAIALGAEEPRWIRGAWWHDRSRHALEYVRTCDDVARIPIPDWLQTPIVQRMLASRERGQRDHPEEAPPGLGITCYLELPGREPVEAVAYPSFVDLGVYLMGIAPFLALLASDAEAADALMDVCLALSTSYVDALLALQPAPIEMLCGFGGDAVCMLSPALYRRYSAAFDERLLAHVRRRYGAPDDLPCNLHSCGPSAHLYGEWARHPCHANIVTMQTRLLPGEVARLRQSLPETRLELTLHPPHVDPASATPTEVSALLLDSARDAGFADLGFTLCVAVHNPDDLPRAAANLRAADAAMAEIRAEFARRYPSGREPCEALAARGAPP